MKRLLFISALVLALVLPVLALADGHVTWVHTYDPALGEFPEGIAVDKTGNVFVGLSLPEIRKIDPHGNESLYHQFAVGAPVGLAVDAVGNLYSCVFVPPPADPTGNKGVWRISRNGDAVHLPGSDQIGLPNALAFDKRGNLYVSDSYVFGSWPPEGAIWRIPPGGEAEVWYQDADFLGGLGQIPGYVPLGANGISFYHGSLYVANTERGLIARIPVLPDGSPGEPSIVVNEPVELYLLDGIALDVYGTIYAALVGQDRIVTVDPATGQITEVANAGDGVDGPASLAFGTGMGERQNVFFTNYAYPFEPDSHPGVLKMETGVPGLPLP